jgi:hypothetical protein
MRTVDAEIPGRVGISVAVGVRPVVPTTVHVHREAVDRVVVVMVTVVGPAVVVVRVVLLVGDRPRHDEVGLTALVPGLVGVASVVPVVPTVPVVLLAIVPAMAIGPMMAIVPALTVVSALPIVPVSPVVPALILMLVVLQTRLGLGTTALSL